MKAYNWKWFLTAVTILCNVIGCIASTNRLASMTIAVRVVDDEMRPIQDVRSEVYHQNTYVGRAKRRAHVVRAVGFRFGRSAELAGTGVENKRGHDWPVCSVDNAKAAETSGEIG